MPDLVYIADDEPNIRKLAALALKDSGFETQEFADGVSLMAAVRVRKPDAIVLDWMMSPPTRWPSASFRLPTVWRYVIKSGPMKAPGPSRF